MVSSKKNKKKTAKPAKKTKPAVKAAAKHAAKKPVKKVAAVAKHPPQKAKGKAQKIISKIKEVSKTKELSKAKPAVKAKVTEKPVGKVKEPVKAKGKAVAVAVAVAVKPGKPAKAAKAPKPVVPKKCKKALCKELAILNGYCRLHYITNWKLENIDKKVKRLQQMDKFISEIKKRFPPEYIDLIKDDLASDKTFRNVLTDMDLEEDISNFEQDDETQKVVSAYSGSSATGGDDEDF